MIPDKINSILELIDFLNSKIKDYQKLEELNIRFWELMSERDLLQPQINLRDKLKFEKIQTQILELSEYLRKPYLEIINYTISLGLIVEHNGYEFRNIIIDIKSNSEFQLEDIDTILPYQKKYNEYRKLTSSFRHDMLFHSDLDDALNDLYTYLDPDLFGVNKELKKNENITLKSDINNNLVLTDVFNQPYKTKVNHFLDILVNYYDDVLDLDYKFIDIKGNKGLIGRFFKELKKRRIISLNLNKKNSIFICSQIKGMPLSENIFDQSESQKFNDQAENITQQINDIINNI